MPQQQGSFTISYPLGIDDGRIKRLMLEFTKMMTNGFAHYHFIESVIVTWERVYVVVEDHIKEYALRGEYGLQYITSHDKGFKPLN